MKKLLLIFISLFTCCFILSSCQKSIDDSQFFNFEQSACVNITYKCCDEQNDFEKTLTEDQSAKLIASLNKISYSEINDRDLLFSPSYDNLTIKINQNIIRLFDVYSSIYGGTFYYNGKYCSTFNNFLFLKEYVDIPPYGIDFDVQYVKSSVCGIATTKIIKNVNELNLFVTEQNNSTGLKDEVLFDNKIIDKYNEQYFENNFVVVFMREFGSGSYKCTVKNVYVLDNTLTILYNAYMPGEGTCDMAYWYFFVEINNKYSDIKDVNCCIIN